MEVQDFHASIFSNMLRPKPIAEDRIEFVGGIRGITELERRAQSGCAFAMHPTGIADLLAVADAGGLMPPKSTWFEPKLRDGLFCHML